MEEQHTFASNVFNSKIDAFAKTYTRVDVVFDQYKSDSLKSYTREVRGSGERQKVTSNGHVPNNWEYFLRNNDNKTELYSLLAKSVYNVHSGLVYATINNSSVCNKIVRSEIPCCHEEADTRMFVHLKHALEKDLIKSACILANDSDVVIIAISFFCDLKLLGLEQLWVSFGLGNKRRWIPIHAISQQLGPEKSKGMLFFHAFSDCDTVSGFRYKKKKSFLQTWNVFSRSY